MSGLCPPVRALLDGLEEPAVHLQAVQQRAGGEGAAADISGTE